MKKFKVTNSYSAPDFDINRENFECESGNKHPFQQKNQQGKF